MVWREAHELEHRTKVYRDFLEHYREELSELIIHPADNLEDLATFSKVGVRRYGDYLFFSSDEFLKLLGRRSIRVITWPEV